MRKHVIALGLSLAVLEPSLALAKPSAGSAAIASKQGKKAKPVKEKAPCFAPEVKLVRRRGNELEGRSLSLTYCDGKPNPAALDSLSVLARPRDVERPQLAEIRAYQRLPVGRGPKAKRRDAAFLTKQVMRLHPGLLERLERVAQRYPGKAIEIISGHRPDARETSRHHHGKALDMRVVGVSREALRDFLRTFPETGVGYYPNSYFVHMDVREDQGYWVDRSGPGEAPDYGPWPPPKATVAHESAKVLSHVLGELSALDVEKLLAESHDPFPSKSEQVVREPTAAEAHDRTVKASDLEARGSAREQNNEDADLSSEEVERIRKQAREAVESL